MQRNLRFLISTSMLTLTCACSAGGSKTPFGGVPSGEATIPGAPSSTPTIDLGGAITDINIDPTQTCNPCTHFAGGPVFEDNLGPDIAKSFPSASGASGPCILEPQAGTLLPTNWLRPRFHFEVGTAPYRISLSTPRETGTLDIYTADTIALLPKPVWDGPRANVFEPV